MPKSYLTITERQNAENKRFNSKQDDSLRVELKKAKKQQKLTFIKLAEKANIGLSTVQKILNLDTDLGTVELDKIRAVCSALGLRMKFQIE